MKTWLRSWVRVSILRKGLSGQSKFWLYVGVIGLVRRGYRRFAQKDETVVLGERILPGQRLEIFNTELPSRRAQRRNAKR